MCWWYLSELVWWPAATEAAAAAAAAAALAAAVALAVESSWPAPLAPCRCTIAEVAILLGDGADLALGS